MDNDYRKEKKLLSEIKTLYDGISADYDNQEGHILSVEEKEIWNKKIFHKYLPSKMNHILDVGAGTGLLTNFIFEEGLSQKITGLEYSEDMIKVAKHNNPTIKYKHGDTHEPELFDQGMFDCIVSRQVTCHFHDPLVAFSNWNHWLKKNGLVVIVDGLWHREGWSNDNLVDRLPISCIQTRATLSYLLSKSGFEILENSFFDREKKKYFVIAKKQ